MNLNKPVGVAMVFLFGLASLCLYPGCSPSESPPSTPSAKPSRLHWKKSTPLPEPRAGHAAGVLDGKFVIAGGTFWEGEKGNWTQKIFSASTHAFDPDTETWERLPDAPIAFGYAAYTVVDNRLFVLGGFDGRKESRKILTLHKEGNEYVWKTFGELPETRLFAWAGSSGSSLYLLGGVVQFEPLDEAGTCCTSKTATNSLSVLDTASPEKGWQELTPYPGEKRWLFSADGNGESIWMFGGIDSPEAGTPPTRFNFALRYELKQDLWQELPSLPPETLEATPLVPLHIPGKILFMSFSKTVWQFDLQSMEYTTLTPLPEEAFVDRFAWLNHRIIGAGGENKIESPRRRSEWTFIGEFRTE
jgi:N-acetylneuraminic acid mutarotase